jgi:hypothetical protein
MPVLQPGMFRCYLNCEYLRPHEITHKSRVRDLYNVRVTHLLVIMILRKFAPTAVLSCTRFTDCAIGAFLISIYSGSVPAGRSSYVWPSDDHTFRS